MGNSAVKGLKSSARVLQQIQKYKKETKILRANVSLLINVLLLT